MIEFYGVDEAAKRLKRHPESVRRACRLGYLAFGRTGRGYRFTDDDLKKYVGRFGSEAVSRKIADRIKHV